MQETFSRFKIKLIYFKSVSKAFIHPTAVSYCLLICVCVCVHCFHSLCKTEKFDFQSP